MNEQQQRIKIAEACGWVFENIRRDAMYYVPSIDAYVGNPLNDRNAMIYALSVLSNSQRIDLLCNLERQGIADDWALLTAEPKAIAQAFLETLNLWTE